MRRVILWVAIGYLLAWIVADFIADHPHPHDMSVLTILPAAGLMLACWWTTDVAPKFARWGIIVICTVGIIHSFVSIDNVAGWIQSQIASFVAYCLIVAGVAVKQLREIHRIERQAAEEPEEAT